MTLPLSPLPPLLLPVPGPPPGTQLRGTRTPGRELDRNLCHFRHPADGPTPTPTPTATATATLNANGYSYGNDRHHADSYSYIYPTATATSIRNGNGDLHTNTDCHSDFTTLRRQQRLRLRRRLRLPQPTATATATPSATATATSSPTPTPTPTCPWHITGFYQPVDMGNVVNVVKGGSTVPLKFNVYDCNNVEKTSVSDIMYQSAQFAEYNCNSGPDDEIPMEDVPNTGATALRYDTTGHQFIQNWKTPNTKNKCYVVRVTTITGVYIEATARLSNAGTTQSTPRLILLTPRRRCHSESMTRVGSWEDSSGTGQSKGFFSD